MSEAGAVPVSGSVAAPRYVRMARRGAVVVFPARVIDECLYMAGLQGIGLYAVACRAQDAGSLDETMYGAQRDYPAAVSRLRELDLIGESGCKWWVREPPR